MNDDDSAAAPAEGEMPGGQPREETEGALAESGGEGKS